MSAWGVGTERHSKSLCPYFQEIIETGKQSLPKRNNKNIDKKIHLPGFAFLLFVPRCFLNLIFYHCGQEPLEQITGFFCEYRQLQAHAVVLLPMKEALDSMRSEISVIGEKNQKIKIKENEALEYLEMSFCRFCVTRWHWINVDKSVTLVAVVPELPEGQGRGVHNTLYAVSAL